MNKEMSKEDNSGGGGGESQDALGPDVPSDAPARDSSRNAYDDRGPRKIVRVVTVIAYLFSVSFVGIILSAYYIFLWEPPNARLVGHLRADPRMQFLIAAVPEGEADPEETETIDSSLESESNRTVESDSLLGRAIQDARYDGDQSGIGPAQRRSDKISLEKRGRLSRMLFRLRQSLVKALRARNENSSHQVPNSADDSRSARTESWPDNDSAKRTDHARLYHVSARDESHGNIVREKTSNDNTDPSEFTASTKTLNAEKAFELATIPEASKTNHDFGDFDGKSVSDADRTRTAIDRERGELDVQRSFSEIGARFRQELTKRDGIADDRRVIALPIGKEEENPNRDPNDARFTIATIATIALRLEEYAKNRSESRLPSSVNADIDSSELNDRGNNASSSNNRTERVTRVSRVSVGLPIPSDLIEDPEFDHRPPNYPRSS